MRSTLPLLVLLGLAGFAHPDTVTLKNGDRVTGKIVKKDGPNLTVKTDLLGTVDLAWDAVTKIASDQPLVVVLPDGTSVTGTLVTRNETLEIATPAARASAPRAEVRTIRNAAEQAAFERLQSPGWGDLWAGHVDLGLSAARGNARTTSFTTAANTARTTRADKTHLYFNQIFATASLGRDSATTAQAVRGGWAYNKNAGPRLLWNVFNDYEYDRFQNLDLRFVAGGGLGYIAVKNERGRLDLLGGASYNRESFATPLVRKSGEAYWGDDWSYKVSGITSLRQSLRIFHNLTSTGEYRVNFDVGATTSINKWLAWQLTVSDRYLSNPVAGRRKNDILYSTGLRVTFAR